MESGSLESAKKYLDLITEKVDSILDNPKLKENRREAQFILSERIEVAEGGVGDIEYLLGRLKCAQYAIRRLEVLWAIALHYKNTGNEKKRRETLEMIKEEAGKTWYGSWAEKEMKQG